ncbi:imidazolonepropionase [Aestuariivirga litoralis]|uniref:imidazolonepropionase n=1 Tax=Aestuariivirga litoralis TaxID=2650924 RepID=UPI0018C73E40|nr:imidazolonepropionase [Aestuariivirga litoralis]MBG1232659.1 imidazolonepropionase [Aestuariivirga litoralis]
MSADRMLFINATAATMAHGGYGLIEDVAIACENGAIGWVGRQADCPAPFKKFTSNDLGGRLITPALIDCHTHIVYGGNRAAEFEMRLKGATYEEVARAGGGIVSTVKATRQASLDDLVQQALPRIDALLAEGVAVIEIKSGYGLDIETEINMLRAARRIEQLRAVKIVTSFLGAHAIPPEYKDRANLYIDDVCIPALKAAHAEKLVDAVDGFCEGIAFSPAQITRVFDVAKALGLPIKLHAEQLSNLHGAALAASYGALSVEHLEYVDEAGVAAMAKAGSVANILPGAFYTLREKQAPPIDLFRKHKVPMAISTDANPGSSPLTSLLLAMNMACTLFRMTPEEALLGVTAHAAKALGLNNHGVIAEGHAAQFAVWNITHPAELSYRIGFNPLHQRIMGKLA